MESKQVGFLFVWSMEIHMSRVRIWITLTSLPIAMYMSREGRILLTGLTMEIYMTREGWYHIKHLNHGELSSQSYDPIKQLNHGDLYIK